MKYKIHVPVEQYGFVEIETEVEITPEDLKLAYDEVKQSFTTNGTGVDAKTFNEAIDRYLTDGTGETETYVRMSREQQSVFQEIKKSLKRIEAKNSK
jgi:Fic family protein